MYRICLGLDVLNNSWGNKLLLEVMMDLFAVSKGDIVFEKAMKSKWCDDAVYLIDMPR